MKRSVQITLSQIRAVEAVARIGSVLGAAQALGVSQPSVSAQLRAVESQARAPIFIRDGKRFRLSAFGEALSRRLRAAVAAADEIDAMLQAESALRSGALALAYSSHQYAMPVISEFARLYPGVEIEARCVASRDALRRVHAHQSDAAFVTARAAQDGMRCLRLHCDRIVMMAPSDHPLAQLARPATWRDIAAHPVIRREESSETRRVFETVAARAGITLTASLAVGSWSSMAAAVAAGVGVGVALEGEMGAAPAMRAIPIADPDLWAGHYLVAPDALAETAAVSTLFAIARQQLGGDPNDDGAAP